MTDKPTTGNDTGLDWFKSSYSDDSDSNECVEVAATPGTVHVRDSKNTQGPQLAFTEAQWAAFVTNSGRAFARD